MKTKFFAVVLLLSIVLFLSGCGMLAGSKSKSESLQTAERINARQEATFRKVSDGNPGQSPDLTIRGKQNTVTYNFPPAPAQPPHEETDLAQSSGQIAGTETSWLFKSKWTIPLGVSILLVGVGLLVLWFALGKIKRSSVAAAAAFKIADETVASCVERIGTKMATSTTPDENARNAAEMALLEKQRRKLAESKNTTTPPP